MYIAIFLFSVSAWGVCFICGEYEGGGDLLWVLFLLQT